MPLLFFAVGAATVAILAVMLISLVRQVRRVAGALGEFNAAISPVLEDLQREAERAQGLTDSITEKQRALDEDGDRAGRAGARRPGRR